MTSTDWLQVEDGHPLALWRGTVEVDAPQRDVFQRVLREQGQWQSDLQHSEAETLDKDSEIYQYTLQAVGTRPPLQHLLLRYGAGFGKPTLGCGGPVVRAYSSEGFGFKSQHCQTATVGSLNNNLLLHTYIQTDVAG